MDSMRDKAIGLLKELTEAHGAPGFEDEVRAIFADELADCGVLSTDGNGSVFCEAGDGPRVLLAGHMDEVAFRVQNITPDGFIQFVTLGGWWPHTLLAQRVEVRTRDGRKILGVVSSTPPHFLPAAQRKQVLEVDQMFIDVGAKSRNDLEGNIGIRIGDPIVPCTAFSQMDDPDLLMAKAFDNRVGMACAVQATQILQETAHPNTLIACGTVQEEVGCRGAMTAAVQAQPDVVIVLEGTPADDTPGFSRASSQGAMGRGVQIRMQDPSAMMNPALVDFCVATAEEEKIPHQLALRASGGTDASKFHLSGRGVPTIVLGVPSRYIHSHNSMIDVKDYLTMVDLSVALIKKLGQEEVDAFTRYL